MTNHKREKAMKRFRAMLISVPVVVFATTISASALVSGPTAVSGTSPFVAGCEGVPTAAAFGGAEVEPFVATDPTNSQRLIGVWQQDRFPDGGARGLGTAVSTDGGVSWATVTPPTFSRCSGGTVANGGDLERATDPWVSIGKDTLGQPVAYQISDSFNDTNPTNAILVSRSTNGGTTWDAPVTLLRESGGVT